MLKSKTVSQILMAAVVSNLLVAGVALAVSDSVNDQVLINDGSLAISYTLTEQLLGTFQAAVVVGDNTFQTNLLDTLTFENTTGSSNPFTVSVNTQNLQATTGFAAASTGFNYTNSLEFNSDSDSTITFDAGSVGSSSVALSNTGNWNFFEGSGASGGVSSELDIATGSGETFNLVGQLDPKLVVYYHTQLPGFYVGTMTFTII